MPAHEFFFAVDASGSSLANPTGADRPDDLLRVITVEVLEHAGLHTDAEAIVAAVRGAVRQVTPDGDRVRPAGCRVQFSVEGHELAIVVTSSSGRSWRQTHRIS